MEAARNSYPDLLVKEHKLVPTPMQEAIKNVLAKESWGVGNAREAMP